MQHRAAERAAELVALQAVARRREEVARVEVIVADELEDVAAERVGARLGDQVHRRRGVVAVARRQRAGLDLELLQRVGERRRQVQVVERIVVGAAVHDVGDAVGLAAGDRDRDGRVVLVGVEVARRRGRRQPGQEDQLGRLAAVQRNLGDLLVVDDLPDAGGARFDGRAAAR